MAISSINYAQFEHNKRQRKPAIAGSADVETFDLDCKIGCDNFRLVAARVTRCVTQNAFPRREKR
jgi:hypothetical protein